MNWFYYLWCFAFASGRTYGNKGANYYDELPFYSSDLKRFLNMLKEHKGPFWLVWLLNKEISRLEKE